MENRDKFNKTQMILILSLIFIAAGLRLPKIGIPIYDEEYLDFFWFGQLPLRELILEYVNTGQRTLVAILWKITKAVFGENEIAYRSGSWVPGILAIPLLYKIVFLLFRSHAAGFIAGAMLAFSYPHLKQSLYLRGYSLTTFLALAVTYCVIMITWGRSTWLWGTLFLLTGISLILTLPSNATFLAAITLFYLISIWDNKKGLNNFLRATILKSFTPFLVLWVIVVAYFFKIYSGLQNGMLFYKKYYLSIGYIPTWNWFGEAGFAEVCQELSEPWGLGLYLFFAYGLVVLKIKRKLFSFLVIFIVPIAVFMLKNVSAPGKTYICYLPFILTIVALAIVDLFSKIRLLAPKTISTAIVFLLGSVLIWPVYFKTIEHYKYLTKKSVGPTMVDARIARKYLEKKILPNHIVVLPNLSYILDYYVVDWVDENNVDVLREGMLEGIYFFDKSDQFDIENFTTHAAGNPGKLEFPDSFISLVGETPGFKLYRYSGKIRPISPEVPDPDFESKLDDGKKNSVIDIKISRNERVAGKTSLKIIQRANAGKVLQFYSSASPTFSKWHFLENEENFILSFYIKKYNQRNLISIYTNDINTRKLKSRGYYFLNNQRCLFKMESSKPRSQLRFYHEYHHDIFGVPYKKPDSYWECKMGIQPLKKGTYKFMEFFTMEGNEHIFDGIQSYLLTSS